MSCVRGVGAGNLNQLIWLQKNTGTQNTVTGAVDQSWTNVSEMWAEIMTMTARERIDSQQVTPELSHKIRVRYRDDVLAERRLLIPQNSTTLGAAIANASVTSITTSDADLVKSDSVTVLRCESEFLLVTAGFGTTSLTVTRGAFGSTAAAHSNGLTLIRMGIVEIDNVIDTGNAHIELILTCKGKDNV